ncbi:MAG: RNA 2'-phosphotransferase [Planctomycetaceae bacterium]
MSTEKEMRTLSRFLSLVLRHQPQEIGICLDDAGWTSIDELLSALHRHGRTVTRETLEQIVATSDKQRFCISDDGRQIRANQGHSVTVNLGYKPADPPEFLLHGTPDSAVAVIRREGLKKMQRHHVHLHENVNIAEAVGARRGTPVLLRIRAGEMAAAGFEFQVTPNRVWLTDHVPVQYIDFPESTRAESTMLTD